MHPFSGLPLADAIRAAHPPGGSAPTADPGTVLAVQEGPYRLLNAGSGKCLSYTARPATASTLSQGPGGQPGAAIVAGWTCGVPGKDDDLNQVWTVRSPPPPKATTTATKAAAPRTFLDAVIFETISPTLATTTGTTGARHQFRLDLAGTPPAVTPTIFHGRSAIPNKLAPPILEIFVPPLSPDVPPPPPEPPQPTLAAYVETLLASPKAASTSSWQVLRVGSDQFQRQYLLFNPSSRRYLGHTPTSSFTSSPLAGPTSVLTSTAANGTPVQAVDLESYLNDVATWLHGGAGKKANVRNVVASVNAQLLYFAWAFQRADLGPVQGSYRIVHNQTQLALDGLPQLAVDAIRPPAKSQVWDVAPSASSTASINYSIFNHVSQKPLNSGQWRLIFIPPVGPKPAVVMPSPTPVAPTQFLLMDTISLSMLGVAQVEEATQVVQVDITDLFVAGDVFNNATPKWENIVTKHMLMAIDVFREDSANLVWRLYPESWAPADRGQSPPTNSADIAEGVYSFQSGSSFLDVPPATSSSIIPLSLSPPSSFPSLGSEWWRIASSVDASGAIYQTVINYRSGHAIDLSSSGALVGQRLGNARGERWRLVAAKDGNTSFAFQDSATYGAGVIVHSGVPVYGSSAEANATWTVRKVDMALPDGEYFLLNLGLNLFLSAAKTVTLSPTPTPWTLSTTPQGRTITTSSGVVLGASSGNAILASSFTPIGISRDMAKGGSIIAMTSDSTVLTGSANSTLSFAAQTDSLSQRWRMITTSDLRESRLWTVPSWLGRTQSGSIPNVPDGVYRISRRQGGEYLVLVDGGDDQGPREVVMTNTKRGARPASERKLTQQASPNQLWYVERNRNSSMQTYTITSMSRKVNLQERLVDVGQPVSGLSICAGRDGYGTPAVIASQQWMFWKTSSGGKSSGIGWVLQAVGGSGGLLDYPGSGSLSTRPQLDDAPISSQVWQLVAPQAEMSSGFYRFRDNTSQTFLSFTPGSTVNTGSYTHNSSDWKLVTQSNGLYTIQGLGDLSFLTGTSGVDMLATPDYWMLLPSSGSVILQNVSTRQFLTNTKGVVAITAVGTQWAFERVDSPSPVFSDQSSDKVVPANYSIVNVATSQILGWPPSPALGSAVVCSSTGSNWTIVPSTGYYSMSLSKLTLGSGAIASVSGLDSSLWKLVRFDTGTYRIINKVTGLLLSQDAKGSVVEETQNSLSDHNEWILVQDPKSVSNTAANLSREVPVTNGIYVIANSSTSTVVTLPTTTSSPILAEQDLGPYSTSFRTQLWIVEQKRDLWYIVKSFSYGLCLGCKNTTVVCASDDGSDTFRWKFIQDKTANTRLVAKTSLAFVLSAAPGLSVVLYSGDLTQQWNLTRTTGTPRNTKLPQGTYLISQFVSPSIGDAQKQAEAMSASFMSDAVNGVTASVSLAGTNYAKGPQGTLPTGVGAQQVQTALAGSDSNNAPAVAEIVAIFFGNLFAATQAASPTPPTPHTAPAGGTARTLTVSVASDQIGGILVDFCKTAAATPVPDAGRTIAQINTISTQTLLLADTTATAVQALMISSGQIILARIDTYVQTLKVPVTPIDPNAPLTLTLTGNSVTAGNLVTQQLSQYFLIESTTGDAFQISHLTTRQFLSVVNNTVSLTLTSFNWTVSLQRSGGYAVFPASSTTTDMVLSLSSTSTLGLSTFVPDDNNAASTQRWQLRRTGYYLQNQSQRNFFNLACSNFSLPNPNNGVSMTPWQPFSQSRLLNGTRSDAFNTWHLDKAGSGQYRLYNEFTRTLLRNRGDSDNNLSTSTDVSTSPADLWQFAKNDTALWLQCQDLTKKWLAVNSSNSLVLMDAGAKEPFKGWQLVSLAQTERGPLTSMPRFALVSLKDQQVYGDSATVQYKPDNSLQRYRSYTYGKNTIYINEATTNLLRSDGKPTALSSTNDPTVWWTTDDSKNTVPTESGNSLFSPVSNTGDLQPSTMSVRIQLANGQALSVSQGVLVVEPLDRMSSAQVWFYLDWQQGRFITHANTSSMLGVGGTSAGPTLTLSSPNSYSSSTLWTIDISSSSSAKNNGFFPLRPITNATFCVQPTMTLNTTNSGVRFLRDSSSFAFATRALVLNTFIRTHAPVFCFTNSSPLPLSVDAYLSQATLLPTNTPASVATLSTGTSLVYNGAVISDGTTATSYVTVRDSADAAYVNYTDLAFYLLYTSGWTHVTLRYSNDTKNLEAALFPSLGWIYNLDSNYNSTFTAGPDGTTNPLKILKRADGTTRLHVFVDPSGAYSPTFPADEMAKTSLITTDSTWSMVVDAGGGDWIASPAMAVRRATGGQLAGKKPASGKSAAGRPTPKQTSTRAAGPGMVIVQAYMVSDDENGTGITPPDWAEWSGKWGSSNFP